MFQLKTFALASLVAAVSAHQNLHEIFVNDVSAGFEVGIRRAPSNSPVVDVTSNDIVCNVGGTSGAGVKTVEVKAGDKITVQWDQSTHPGPITHMLHGPVASAESATGVGEWAKIDELDAVDGKWANEIMSADGMKHTFTIPTGAPTGEYLLRSEMLALHGAQTIGGGQFYIGCVQLKIVGTSTTGTCGPKITLPGAYDPEDPSIYIPNVYNGFDISSYTAPGGPVVSCGAGGAAPAPAPVASSSAAPVVSSSAVVAPVPTASALPTTSAVTAPVPVTTPVAVASSTFATSVRPATSSAIEVAPTASAPVVTPVPTYAPEETAAPAPTSSKSKSACKPKTKTSLPTAIPTGAPSTPEYPEEPATTAPAPATTSAAAGSATASKWGQCGGLNYKGPTACAAGSRCVVSNDWYSQCV